MKVSEGEPLLSKNLKSHEGRHRYGVSTVGKAHGGYQ